ncbi:methionyl-tRNA formyltransferase [Mangrovitalea sediminis]|uniref:methionyl-tRNA formyltransferase n=1 Tax=Mangrovitalea sediminis TaxID=1982043 RepID=UPI000BE53786|nr:methionyl-tRNA formyltransferase [Mangrovitalea sediminis]
MRIVFAGTPEFAAVSLKAILAADADYNVVAVYTQPDRPAGRGRKLVPSEVKQVAENAGIPVYQPASLKGDEAQQTLAALEADVMVVAAYGLILPKAILETPRLGCLNIHASLLPRWRGAAPIQRAIAAGDTETGITIMQMDVGLDTGDMLLKIATPIHADDTGGSLHDRLADIGGQAICDALRSLAEGTLKGEKQDDSQASYAAKLSKDEGHIDWQRSSEEIDRQIRAFNPWPGTYTDDGDNRVRIHAATPMAERQSDEAPGTVIQRDRQGILVACGDGVLQLDRIQLPGARALSSNDLINGGKPLLLAGNQLR